MEKCYKATKGHFEWNICCRMCDAGMEFRIYFICINGGIKSFVKITDGWDLSILLQEYLVK